MVLPLKSKNVEYIKSSWKFIHIKEIISQKLNIDETYGFNGN